MSSGLPDRQAFLSRSCPKNAGNLRQFTQYCRQLFLYIVSNSLKNHYYSRFFSNPLPVPQYGYPLSPPSSLFSLLPLPRQQFSAARIHWIISGARHTLCPSSNSLFLKPFVPSARSHTQTGPAFVSRRLRRYESPHRLGWKTISWKCLGAAKHQPATASRRSGSSRSQWRREVHAYADSRHRHSPHTRVCALERRGCLIFARSAAHGSGLLAAGFWHLSAAQRF